MGETYFVFDWLHGNLKIPTCSGQVAQLVEQRTENPRVGGSSPSLATTPSSLYSFLQNFHLFRFRLIRCGYA